MSCLGGWCLIMAVDCRLYHQLDCELGNAMDTASSCLSIARRFLPNRHQMCLDLWLSPTDPRGQLLTPSARGVSVYLSQPSYPILLPSSVLALDIWPSCGQWEMRSISGGVSGKGSLTLSHGPGGDVFALTLAIVKSSWTDWTSLNIKAEGPANTKNVRGERERGRCLDSSRGAHTVLKPDFPFGVPFTKDIKLLIFRSTEVRGFCYWLLKSSFLIP